ncbi:MAG: hypothetical protein JSV65_14700 [Armatimonadota bacterium]|nr:MAG: hypothetical protein JSV65_14700 [Armatimonadota bacterium]
MSDVERDTRSGFLFSLIFVLVYLDAWVALAALAAYPFALVFFPVIGPVLLPLFVLVDLGTLYLAIMKRKRGHGPSGVPLIPWVYYFLFSVFGVGLRDHLGLGTPWLRAVVAGMVLILLTAFHLACQHLIPLWYDRRLRRSGRPMSPRD